MPKPIGVFGGIFDPVHYGHLALSVFAGDFFDVDTIVYIPAGLPPHKTATVSASPTDRLAMLQIALADEPNAVIWEHEIQRSDVSYTIDTLHELLQAYPGRPLYFIVGADNLPEIHTWHRYEEILELVVLCVTERPGFSMEIPPELANARIKTFPSVPWGISSSLLRSYLAQGFQCRHLLPDAVREYIFNKGLYRQCGPEEAVVRCTQPCKRPRAKHSAAALP